MRTYFVAAMLLLATAHARSQALDSVQFHGIPSVDEVIGVLAPGALPQNRAAIGPFTPRTIRDPATNADLTIPAGGGAASPSVPSPQSPSLPAPHLPEPSAASASPVARPPTRRPASIAQPIEFAAGKADLPAAVRQMLNVLATAMVAVPTMEITVTGHTDSSGGPAINEPLSQRRADAARSYLVLRGIAPERVVAIGQGDRLPLPGTRPDNPINRRLQYWPRSKFG